MIPGNSTDRRNIIEKGKAMSEYRAPRVWHIEQRFGRYYVENQFGGFAGWHIDLESALAQGREYVAKDGDTFIEEIPA